MVDRRLRFPIRRVGRPAHPAVQGDAAGQSLEQQPRNGIQQARVGGLHHRRRRHVMRAGALVAQGAVDQHDIGRLAQIGDLPRRRDVDQKPAPRGKKLLGHQHRERRANGTADDAGGAAIAQGEFEQFGMVARPTRAWRGAVAAEMADQVAVGVQHADRRHVLRWKAALPPGLPQQIFRLEHRRRRMVVGKAVAEHAAGVAAIAILQQPGGPATASILTPTNSPSA